MAAKRITQSSVNWAAIAERVPENQKSNFITFKSKSDVYLRRMMANPENPPKIDWAYYKNKIPIAGLVETFQKQYDALKIPFPQDTVSSQINELEKEINSAIQAYAAESNKRIAEYTAEYTKLESLLPFEMMTMEDYREAYPEDAIDPINKPTFWPHTPEEQLDYEDKDAPPQKDDH